MIAERPVLPGGLGASAPFDREASARLRCKPAGRFGKLRVTLRVAQDGKTVKTRGVGLS